MKKTIIPFLLLLVLIACNKTAGNEKKLAQKKSFFLNELEGYQNQLPLYTASSNTAPLNIAIKNSFDTKLNDKAASFETFEKLYTPSLTVAEKEYLAFIILAKKDFIGHVNANKNSKADVEKMKAYITLLVENKYIGYCVLYNALQSLPGTEKDFVDKQLVQIAQYSENDAISKSMLENAPHAASATAKQKMLHAKFLENKKYLDLIMAAVNS